MCVKHHSQAKKPEACISTRQFVEHWRKHFWCQLYSLYEKMQYKELFFTNAAFAFIFLTIA